MIYEATTDNYARRVRLNSRKAFTLMELMVVISVIVLLLGMALPSISALFSSGADAQARNLVSGLLSTARARAIRDRRPTGVHFQKHHAADDYWAAVVQLKIVEIGTGSPQPRWCLCEGMFPSKLPGGLAIGEVANSYAANFDQDAMDVFTTVTVIFDADGRLYTGDVRFCTAIEQDAGNDDDHKAKGQLFTNITNDQNKARIWWETATKPSVRALCLVNSRELAGAVAANQGAQWLEANAQFLPVNPYTGGLIRNRSE